MDDDTDRSSEATQLEENSTTEEALHPLDDAEDSEDNDDRRDATPLQISPMSTEEDQTTSQCLTLVVSDLSEVPVKLEMQRDELERLKNQLQGSHQEALATVIAQAARVYSEIQISSLQCSNSQADQKDTNDPKSISSSSHHDKTPVDGYNWRKYGQKQVKSPQGSRSYYKCTYSECDAKKIELCDQFNSVTKVVYKSQHKHDPPVFTKGGKILSSPKSLKRKSFSTHGLKGHGLSESVGCESQQNQIVKKSISDDSVLKNPKKQKFIVHASDDVGISADGYRWRKYGQKMVKGNPHPRNYYKCTCAGCGVTKHIEKAVDSTSNIIITYKGVHDHDKPVPKKPRVYGHGVASSSSNRLLTRVSDIEVANNGTNGSAPMLLSVGFEIKRC